MNTARTPSVVQGLCPGGQRADPENFPQPANWFGASASQASNVEAAGMGKAT